MYLFHAGKVDIGPLAILRTEEYQQRYRAARAAGDVALMFDDPTDLVELFTSKEEVAYAKKLLDEDVLGDLPDGHYLIAYENPDLNMAEPAPIQQPVPVLNRPGRFDYQGHFLEA